MRAFALVVRLPAHGPGKVLRVAPFGRAGGDEQLRHLLGIHVFLDRRIGRRAEALENQQHFVALDQLARLLDGFRRAVAVVIGDEIDLAAVDAALGVDLVEIGGDRLADQAVSRGRPAVGIDIADLDLGVACAGIVFLLRQRRGRGEREPESNATVKAVSCDFSSASSLVFLALAASPRESGSNQARQSGGAGRHQVDHENENDAVDRAGKPFRELFGDIRHEQDEQAAEQACPRSSRRRRRRGRQRARWRERT